MCFPYIASLSRNIYVILNDLEVNTRKYWTNYAKILEKSKTRPVFFLAISVFPVLTEKRTAILPLLFIQKIFNSKEWLFHLPSVSECGLLLEYVFSAGLSIWYVHSQSKHMYSNPQKMYVDRWQKLVIYKSSWNKAAQKSEECQHRRTPLCLFPSTGSYCNSWLYCCTYYRQGGAFAYLYYELHALAMLILWNCSCGPIMSSCSATWESERIGLSWSCSSS